MEALQYEIDTRLYPLRKSALVSLYKGYCGFGNDFSGQFIEENVCESISGFLNVSREQVFTAESGSAALCRLISELSNEYGRELKVALPSFSCPELAGAIISAGAKILLLDLNEQLSLNLSSVEFAIAQHADMLIWPSLFGERKRDRKLLEKCKAAGISVILDEAQSFPENQIWLDDLPFAMGALLSFGRSKRTEGLGGGAIVLNESYVPLLENSTCGDKTERKKTGKIIMLPVFNRLDELIKHRGVPVVEFQPIDSDSGNYLIRHLEKLEEREEIRSLNYQKLADAMVQRFGLETLEFRPISSPVPSIAAFSVPSEERYSFIASLAERRVQSTWYYWPLHLYPAFQDVPQERMKSTMRLASQVVILPCGYRHESDEINYMCKAITRC